MIEPIETLTKVPLYAGLLLLVGVCASSWLSSGRMSSRAAEQSWLRRTSALAVWTALVIVAFLFARLIAHTYATFDGDAMTWESLSTIALKSRWGSGWRLQLAAAVAVVAAAFWARRGSPTSALIVTLAVLSLAVAFPMMGHAAGASITRMASTLHLVAAGAWIGTLGVLVLAPPPGQLWARFSPVALIGSSIVVLSGLVMATMYLTTPTDLVFTTYGRTLLLKLALFGGIALCGFLNWRRVRTDGVPATARLELSLAAALIVVTAFLTEIAHP